MAQPVKPTGSPVVTIHRKTVPGQRVVPKQPKAREKKDSLSRESFLNLLVTQLRHQDPLSPMKDHAFVAQMAQFAALEQMQEMNAQLHSYTRYVKTSGQMARMREALELLGHTVRANDPEHGDNFLGLVREVRIVGGEVRLLVDDRLVSREDIVAVVSMREPRASATSAGEPRDETTTAGTNAAAGRDKTGRAPRVMAEAQTNRRND